VGNYLATGPRGLEIEVPDIKNKCLHFSTKQICINIVKIPMNLTSATTKYFKGITNTYNPNTRKGEEEK
jgi:hypothetical protein